MELKEWILQLIEEDKLYRFYKSKQWIELRSEIMKEAHNECEWCRKQGKIVTATEVHHVQYVKKHPELALSKIYTYQGKQYKNLIALCHDCHDKAHGRMTHRPKKKPLTEEQW